MTLDTTVAFDNMTAIGCLGELIAHEMASRSLLELLYTPTNTHLKSFMTGRQNPNVHHRIHNSLPPAPIPSQLNAHHTSPVNLP
jgi:hypothetical protein